MDSMQMGYIFEDLIRRFAEQSNETAGEHFTPREVIKLMVNVLFNADNQTLTQDGIIKPCMTLLVELVECFLLAKHTSQILTRRQN